MNSATKIIVSIGSIAIIATAGIGGFLLATSNNASSVKPIVSSSQTTTATSGIATSASQSAPSTATNAAATLASQYKDGTYTAKSSYYVPHGGSNSVSATVTVSGGKITAVSANDTYTDGESAMYVDSFESSLSGAAVGTSLADATFSRIGGASLTTGAFDSVLDSVRSQAAA